MLRTCSVLLAGLALAAWSSFAQAQEDEARALVVKAMKAHGGKEALKKHLGSQAKYKGTVETMGMTIKVEGEIFHNVPDRMKNIISIDVNNMNLTIQQGYDGKALWMSVMGMLIEKKEKEDIDEMKEGMYCEQVTSLIDLDSKDFKLSPLGAMKIKDQDAVGVRVSKTGKRDVNLWFDKKSNLLIKSENRGKDPFGDTGEVNQEKYYSKYKAVQGVQLPQTLEVHNDGKKLVDLEITEMRLHERLDETYFTRP